METRKPGSYTLGRAGVFSLRKDLQQEALWLDLERDFLVLDGGSLSLHTQSLGVGSMAGLRPGDEELFRKRMLSMRLSRA